MSDKNSLWAVRCRAGRAMLGISTIAELARESTVGRATIERIERGEVEAHKTTIDKLVAFFTSRGVRFVDEPGVIGTPPVNDAGPLAERT